MRSSFVRLLSATLVSSTMLACATSGTTYPTSNPGSPDDEDSGTVAPTHGVGGNGGEDAATDSASPDQQPADAGEHDAAPGKGGGTLDAGGGGTDASVAIDAGAEGARIAIPMYLDPTQSPNLWSEVFDAGGAAVGLLVVSTDSIGPGTSADSTYTAAIASAHAAGELVIGYTYTNSGARAMSDVQSDVTNWYSFYPALDGIFVDEVSDDDSTAGSYYVPLYTYIKTAHPTALVAINPGTMVDEVFMSASDILLTYEDTYVNFLDPSQNPPNPSWVANYPASRFWNIIQEADAGVEANAIELAKAANVGWIYVTNEGPNTAYQNIETGSYWITELADVTTP